MDFGFMWETFLQLLSGVPLTLNLAFTSVAFGAVLAMILALMRMSGVGIIVPMKLRSITLLKPCTLKLKKVDSSGLSKSSGLKISFVVLALG